MKKIVLTFQATVKYKDVCEDDDLRHCGGCILKLCKWIFKNEGLWFSEKLNLVDAKITPKRKT